MRHGHKERGAVAAGVPPLSDQSASSWHKLYLAVPPRTQTPHHAVCYYGLSIVRLQRCSFYLYLHISNFVNFFFYLTEETRLGQSFGKFAIFVSYFYFTIKHLLQNLLPTAFENNQICLIYEWTKYTLINVKLRKYAGYLLRKRKTWQYLICDFEKNCPDYLLVSEITLSDQRNITSFFKRKNNWLFPLLPWLSHWDSERVRTEWIQIH